MNRKTYSTVVDVDIDINEFIEHFGKDVVYDHLEGYHRPRAEFDLSDPVVRLGVIVALRNLGYKVEP